MAKETPLETASRDVLVYTRKWKERRLNIYESAPKQLLSPDSGKIRNNSQMQVKRPMRAAQQTQMFLFGATDQTVV